jgi:hypothetical protein
MTRIDISIATLCGGVAPRGGGRSAAGGWRDPTARGRAQLLATPLVAATLLVIAEDLQLDGEVDLANRDPGGTDSTTGAKFKMLLTPARTSRSAASWAAPVGVATTPIEMPLAPTIAGSSSMWRTRTPPTTVSTLATSMSTMPPTGNPRSPNPP